MLKRSLTLLAILLGSEITVLLFTALLCAVGNINIPVLLRWAAAAACILLNASILAFLPHGGAVAALADHRRKHWRD